MYWLITFLIFIFGLIIGSFINALEYRIDTDLSIVRGRSICPECKKQLTWYDNIPVLSFLFLGGKCRQCKKPISWQYPIVETLTGIVFVACFWKLGLPTDIKAAFVHLIVYFIFSIFILVALHDQKTTYVLSGYVYVAIMATFIFLTVKYTGGWTVSAFWSFISLNLLASALAMLPFALLYLISKGAWMGAGDIEVAAVLGLLLGWPNFLVGLYLAFVIGSVWGLIKVYLFKNAGMKSEIPFAPFLIMGIILSFMVGEQLLGLYVKIFLG